MSVTIEPAEQLEFHRPFTRISKESLHVKNPGNQPVIFKVKTTAPKQYCVRPNAGRIEPNSEIEVQIILQPLKEEPGPDFKCKDKFLVQTAPIQESFEQADVASMWSHVESVEKASMHQHKIKCVFVGPKEEEDHASTSATIANSSESVPTADFASSSLMTTTPAAAAAAAAAAPAPVAAAPPPAVAPPAATAPPPPPVPAPASVAPVAAPVVSEPIVHKEPTPFKQQNPMTNAPTSVNNTTSSTLSTQSNVATPHHQQQEPSVTVSPPVEVTKTRTIEQNNSKEEELKKANEKIKRLEQQLSELEGLRTRNNNGRKLPSTVQPLDAVHQHLAALEKPRSVEGYPPQVVIAVAALVFIFTYLFF
ncbi:PapD-like protein [Pilaira anomala]|nr:PapD-like protein [Pilaira anomala]